jgi:hypothetical protein
MSSRSLQTIRHFCYRDFYTPTGTPFNLAQHFSSRGDQRCFDQKRLLLLLTVDQLGLKRFWSTCLSVRCRIGLKNIPSGSSQSSLSSYWYHHSDTSIKSKKCSKFVREMLNLSGLLALHPAHDGTALTGKPTGSRW